MTLAEKVDYYVARLIYQYRTKDRARATVAIAVKQVIADDVASTLGPAFDLETAVGAQLDVIGKYVGVSRNIGAGATVGYFSLWSYASARAPADYGGTWETVSNTPPLPDPTTVADQWFVASAAGTSAAPIAATWQPGDVIYSDGAAWVRETADNGNGLTTYADPTVNANGIFLTYADAARAVSALTDASYRTVIKLKIILNGSDGTLASIVGALHQFFPGLISVVDTADMNLAYTVSSLVPLSPALLASFLPKPMGVGISVTIVVPSPGGGSALTTEDGDILTTEGGDPLTTESS